MDEDLDSHLLESEGQEHAANRAVRLIDQGEFDFDDFVEGCKSYWPQIKRCLADREGDEFHTFCEKGLIKELSEREE